MISKVLGGPPLCICYSHHTASQPISAPLQHWSLVGSVLASLMHWSLHCIKAAPAQMDAAAQIVPMNPWVRGFELPLRLYTSPLDFFFLTKSSTGCFLWPLHAFKTNTMQDTLTNYLPSSSGGFMCGLGPSTGTHVLRVDLEEILPRFWLSDVYLLLIMAYSPTPADQRLLFQ